MKAAQKFYICEICHNFVGLIDDHKKPLVCCGKEMVELVANTVDASQEKHVPAVEISGNEIHVTVGSEPHPMVDEHWIQFIYVETEKGGQRKSLKPGDAPTAKFAFVDDKPLVVYEYCNLHGLWKKEL